MDKGLKEKYKNASNTPNEPIFTTKDVMNIIGFSSQSTAQRFDKNGLVEAHRNALGHRIYTYNQIEYMKKLQKLIEFDISYLTIKTMLDYAQVKGDDKEMFVETFINLYTKRLYSENRNKARKLKKNK